MPLDQTPVPDELRGLRIALLISGGVAAYKVVDLASALVQSGCEVRVAMTQSAMRFVGAPTFAGVTGSPVQTGMWGAGNPPEPHVFLGDWAQLILVEPEAGHLASGHVGTGRLASPQTTFNAMVHAARSRYDYAGRRVVVTAGGTREPIDPVRFISNYSSGKMGFALAAAAADRGARVTLVTTASHPEHHGIEVRPVETAEEMLAELQSQLHGADLLLMAAAVGDFRPAKTVARKIR